MVFGLGAPEIWIILGLAVLVAFVLLGYGGMTYDVADETVIEGISWEAADQVLFRELSEIRGLPLLEAHAGSYTLARTSRSVWAYVVAVLLFPIGLIFLLFSREDRVQISLSAHRSGCRLRVVGHAKRRDIDGVAATIRRVLPVPQAFTR